MAAPIIKIIKDLKGDNEKVIILALMHVPRLQGPHDSGHLEELQQIVREHADSGHPDISFLGRKALNWVNQQVGVKTSPAPVSATASASASEEKPKEAVAGAEDEADILKRLRAVNASDRDHAWILPHLNGSNERIVASAIEAYTLVAPVKDQIRELKKFLDVDNNRIRANAIIALGSIDVQMVLPYLEPMLNTTRISMRESAVFAISQIPPHNVIKDLLLRCLHDPYRDIRLRALKALKDYHSDDVTMQLKRLANDIDIEICEIASDLLTKIETQKTEQANGDATDDLFDLPAPVTIQSNKQSSEADYDEFMDEDEAFLAVDPMADSIALHGDYLDNEEAPNTPEPKPFPMAEIADLPGMADFPAIDVLPDLDSSSEDGAIPDLFAMDEPLPTHRAEPEPLVLSTDNLFEGMDNTDSASFDSFEPAGDNSEDDFLQIAEPEPEPVSLPEPELEPEFGPLPKIEPLPALPKARKLDITSVQTKIQHKEDEEEKRAQALASLSAYHAKIRARQTPFLQEVNLSHLPEPPAVPEDELFSQYLHHEAHPCTWIWLNKWSTKPKVEVEPKEAKTPAQKPEIKAEIKPEIKIETKPEVEVKVAVEPKVEAKAEAKVSAKVEPKVEPKTGSNVEKPEDLEQKAQELLREIGAHVFQCLQNAPITSFLVQKAFETVRSTQTSLKNYYTSHEPRTKAEFLEVRKLQMKVRSAFVELGKIALQEVRRQKFQFQDSLTYQKRLQDIVKRLQEIRAGLTPQ